MTDTPSGAERLREAAERAGLRSRIDHRPPSCLVRIQDDAAGLGAVAVYYETPKGSGAYSAAVAYRWRLGGRNLLAGDRYGVRDLTRWLTLTRRLRAAQAELGAER